MAFENMERLEVEKSQANPSEDEVMEVEGGKRKREVSTNAEELESQSDTTASKDSKRSRNTLESQSPTAQKESNTEQPTVIPNRESQKMRSQHRLQHHRKQSQTLPSLIRSHQKTKMKTTGKRFQNFRGLNSQNRTQS